MNRPGAIVIGDAAVDTRIQLPDKDVGVGTLKDIRPDLSPGGTVGNTAVALARRPVQMAGAMRKAVEAGREAYLAGRMPKKTYVGSPSSPTAGVIAPAKAA